MIVMHDDDLYDNDDVYDRLYDDGYDNDDGFGYDVDDVYDLYDDVYRQTGFALSRLTLSPTKHLAGLPAVKIRLN